MTKTRRGGGEARGGLERREPHATATLARRGPGGIKKYDPDKGLKTIALAEVAEKHYARAKDATRLTEAIEVKLTEQRNFVLWWDGQEKQAGALRQGKSIVRRIRSETPEAGKNGLPDRLTIHRWRRKLKEEARFIQEVKTAVLKALVVVEGRGLHGETILQSSDSVEWYTPAEYIEAAREVMGGIDLDPASCEKANKTVKADRFYSLADNGLSQEWSGRIWLNPPYGSFGPPFVDKAVAAFRDKLIDQAVLCLNSNSNDCAWFRPLWDFILCFSYGRPAFFTPDNRESGATHGTVFVYLGSNQDAFKDQFNRYGAVVERAR